MDRVTLGDSDIAVSRIALGTWALGDLKFWGEQDEAQSAATIRAALDAGINFIDTAQGYGDGQSEAVIGRALKGRRGEAVIATKAYGDNLRPDAIGPALEASLGRLQTDHVDVYYIHWPNHDVPLADTFGALARLKEAGKIRAGAICNFGPRTMRELAATAAAQPVDCVTHQLPYNLLWRAIEGPILDATRAAGMQAVVYSPLAQGLLTGRYRAIGDVPEHLRVTRFYDSAHGRAEHGEAGAEAELFAAIAGLEALAREAGTDMSRLALAWLLGQPDVASLLVGCRTPQEVAANAAAAATALPAELLARAGRVTAPVRDRLGPNPDMWLAGERSRFV